MMNRLMWLMCLGTIGCSNTPEPTPKAAAIFFADEQPLRVNPNLNPQIELVLRASEGVREVEATVEGEASEFTARDQGNGRYLTTIELRD